MHEYLRILKPGGMLAMTVWQPRRFDYIRQLQGEPPISSESDMYRYTLQSSFSWGCELEENLYGKTGVVYIPYSSNPEVTYGEAFISPDVLASQWSSLFEHLGTFKLDVAQQLVLLRKKPDAPKLTSETLREMARIAKMYDVQSICVTDYNRKVMSGIRNNSQDEFLVKEALLRKTEAQLAEQKRRVEELLDSASWRVTAPLRRAYEIMLKLKGK